MSLLNSNLPEVVPGTPVGSPFDQIRHLDENGEYWVGRELMPLMGYTRWENFAHTVIARAIRSSENTNTFSDQAFSAFTEEGTGGRPRTDYRLNRQAAYLVAMNGDPNKPAVAAAQAYFAQRTREAELAGPAKPMSELEMARQYVMALEREQRISAELEVAKPKANKWDQFLNVEGLIGMRETADMFGVDVRVLTGWLVDINIFRKVTSQAGGGRNMPRKPHQDSGLFVVKLEQKNGWSFPTAYATAKGLDLIADMWENRAAA